MFVVGMTTAPRPVPTVRSSIRSLRVQGGYQGALHLFDDGCGETFQGEMVLHHKSNPPRGPLLNFVSALSSLSKQGWPLILLMEDDITWSQGGWDILVSDIEQVAKRYGRNFLYSIYTSQTVSDPLEKRSKLAYGTLKRGTYEMSFNRKAGGSQAYVFSSIAASALLDEPGFKNRIREAVNMPFDPLLKKENKNCDRDNQVSGALIRLGIPVVYRIPSLVHHGLGSANSSYWVKGPQDTYYFENVASKLGAMAR